MQRLLTMLVFLTGVLCTSYGQTQGNENQVISTPERTNQEIFNQSIETAEPTPTPEEQGFTKYEENGAIIYRKEVNGIVVEYIPTL